MSTSTMVHIRLDEQLKAQATDTLAAMGLSVSDAVRVFLTRIVADQQFPFALQVPNAETRAAMLEARKIGDAGKPRFASAKALLDGLEKAGEK